MSFNQLHHLDQLPPDLGPQAINQSLSIVFATGASLPITLSNDTNYGVVGANTLRTAAQIGNATGAADFGSGVRTAQTLRVTQATDDINNVSVVSSALPTGAATETTLSALNTKVTTTANGIKVDGSAVTQPVSATSLPLPTGAATETTLAAINTKLPAGLTVTSTHLLVDGSGTTQPISATALPLPTGAATETTLSALNTKITSDFGVSSGATRTAAQIGNSTGAALFGAGLTTTQVLRVVLPTDQTAIPVSNLPTTVATNTGAADASTIRVVFATGSTVATTTGSTPYVTSTRTIHASTPVTTGAWVQIVASTAATINRLTCFSSSGSTLELGVGGSGSEVRTLLLPPGGFDASVSLTIASGTRLSVRAVDADATAGELQFNFIG